MTKTWLEWPREAFKCCLTIPKRLINGINGLIHLVFQKKILLGWPYRFIISFKILKTSKLIFFIWNNKQSEDGFFVIFFIGLVRFWIEMLAWLVTLLMRTATLQISLPFKQQKAAKNRNFHPAFWVNFF